MFVPLLLFCILGLVSSYFSCDYVDDYNAYSWQNATYCFHLKPFSSSIRKDTINTVKAIHDVYVYRDINKNSGYPYNIQVDVEAELDNILNKEYTYDYDVHADIQEVIGNLKDAHTKYVPPFCYAGWEFDMPFRAKMTLENGKKKIIVTSPTDYVLLNYGDVYPEQSRYTYYYKGWEIKKINGNNAYSEILNYAKKTNSYSRDEGVRFNDALSTFFESSAMMYRAPEKESVEFELYNSVTEETAYIEPKWMAHSQLDFSSESFNYYCGYSFRRDEKEGFNLFDSFFPNSIKQENIFVEDSLLGINVSQNLILLEKKMKEKKQKKIPNERRNLEMEDYDTILDGADIKCYSAEDNSHGVLSLLTFAPSLPNTIVEDMQTCLSSMKEKKIEKLIIDLRENGGGYACLIGYLAKMISPYIPKAYNPLGDTISNSFYNELYLAPQYSFVNSKRKALTGDNWQKGNYNTRGGVNSQYSVNFGFDCSMFEYLYIQTAGIKSLETIIPFEPENLILLTEGKCGSACGFFVSLFKQLKLARVVSQGGIPESKLALSSFKGASVLNTQQLDSEKIPAFPGQQMMTFSWFESYPFNEVSLNELEKQDTTTPIGYMKFDSDVQVNNWNFDRSDSEIYGIAKQYFEGCFSWEIQKSSECKPQFSKSVYGHPCKNGEFDTSDCVLRGCVEGYYLNEDQTKCIKEPTEFNMLYYYIRSMVMMFLGRIYPVLIFIGVCCCACCICIIVIIVACVSSCVGGCCLCAKSGSGNKETAYTRVENNQVRYPQTGVNTGRSDYQPQYQPQKQIPISQVQQPPVQSQPEQKQPLLQSQPATQVENNATQVVPEK